MRILIATTYSASGGGLSSHVGDLIRCLEQHGHDVTRIGYEQIKLSPLQRVRGVVAALGRKDRCRREFARGRRANLARHIDAACAETRFDLIHCHDPIASYAARLGKHSAKLPLVQTIHGLLAAQAQSILQLKEGSPHLAFLKGIEAISFQQADRLIAVDTSRARDARSQYQVDLAKIDIITNAVFCDELERIAGEEPEVAIAGDYVITPRRLVPKNGVDVAVRALGLIKDRSSIKLAIVGVGGEEARLRALAAEAGITDRVLFLGWQIRDEVVRLGSRALAVLVPSKPDCGDVEATSIAAIEAMAVGTPVIVSAIGGLAELVKSGDNGLSVPPDQPQALADAILRIGTDPAFREQIGRRGLEHARSELDASVWSEKVLAVYGRVRSEAVKS